MTFIAPELLVCGSNESQEQLLVLVFTGKDIRNKSDPLGLVRILKNVYAQPVMEEVAKADSQLQVILEDHLSLPD